LEKGLHMEAVHFGMQAGLALTVTATLTCHRDVLSHFPPRAVFQLRHSYTQFCKDIARSAPRVLVQRCASAHLLVSLSLSQT